VVNPETLRLSAVQPLFPKQAQWVTIKTKEQSWSFPSWVTVISPPITMTRGSQSCQKAAAEALRDR
jgi:hypothetical protein